MSCRKYYRIPNIIYVYESKKKTVAENACCCHQYYIHHNDDMLYIFFHFHVSCGGKKHKIYVPFLPIKCELNRIACDIAIFRCTCTWYSWLMNHLFICSYLFSLILCCFLFYLFLCCFCCFFFHFNSLCLCVYFYCKCSIFNDIFKILVKRN